MVLPSVRCEQQGLVRRQLRRVDPVEQGAPADPQRVGIQVGVAEHVGPRKGVDHGGCGLTRTAQAVENARVLVDDPVMAQCRKVDEDHGVTAAGAEDELGVGDGDVGVDVRGHVAVGGPVPQDPAVLGVDLERILPQPRHAPVLPVASVARVHAERHRVEDVEHGVSDQVPARRRQLDPAHGAGDRVEDADLARLAP